MKLNKLESISKVHPIIVYDGVCMLCEKFIQDIIRADKAQILRFQSLQNVDDLAMNSVILIESGKKFYKSDVILRLNELIALNKYHWIKYLPNFARDWGYSLIARYRYSFFGKKNNCSIPPSFPGHLFLDA